MRYIAYKGMELPLPLSEEEFKNCYIDMKDGSIEARKCLIERNLRLVPGIANKYASNYAEFEDLVSIGTIGLIKSIDTFSIERNILFSSYAYHCIENEMLMWLRYENNKYNKNISLSTSIGEDEEQTIEDILEDKQQDLCFDSIKNEQKEFIEKFLLSLKERDRKIMEMRYGFYGQEPMTQQEIADVYGITKSCISKVDRKNLKKLRNELLKLGYIEMSSIGKLEAEKSKEFYVRKRDRK